MLDPEPCLKQHPALSATSRAAAQQTAGGVDISAVQAQGVLLAVFLADGAWEWLCVFRGKKWVKPEVDPPIQKIALPRGVTCVG